MELASSTLVRIIAMVIVMSVLLLFFFGVILQNVGPGGHAFTCDFYCHTKVLFPAGAGGFAPSACGC